MKRGLWLAALVALLLGCSGSDGSGKDVVGTEDAQPTDDGRAVRIDAGVTDGSADEMEQDQLEVLPGDQVDDQEVVEDGGGDVPTEVIEDPVVELAETTVDEAEPGCDDCVIISHDTWDGSWDPAGPEVGQYDFPWTDDKGDEWIFYFRPWMRMRAPHPGTVTRLLVYTAGGAGELEIQLSTGFPGGHYPCLDEMSGEDLYPVGKPYIMPISDEPGWREIDVSELGFEVLGYDEFFILWRHVDDCRVALSFPKAPAQGDYGAYGGLIADAPGDEMTCFSSMDNFKDIDENPLVWLVRAEIKTSTVVTEKGFADQGDDGPKVGGHVAFADYDNDGDQDFLTGGALWQNDGAGGYANVTEVAGLADSGLGGETVWGDYDNDGFRDILGIGGNGTLMHNLGDGTFENVTEAAGIVLDTNTQGVTWIDIDNDGYLDFFAASYGTQEDGEKATRDFLYWNNGDGTFLDITETAGIPVSPIFSHGRGVCVTDYDGDGDADIYVGNYRLDPNQLWQNGGDLTFEDVAWDSGVKGTFVSGAWGHTIGPGFAELNGDGLMDLVVPNLDHPRFYAFSDPTFVYFNAGDGTFDGFSSGPFEESVTGIRYDETHSDSTLFDADNDGDVDLFLTSVYEGRRSYLYANDGQGVFTDVTYAAGIEHFNGWGAAAADVDGDGDVDLLAHRLFRNEHNGTDSLRVKLVGGATPEETAGWSNRDAIGAIATLIVGDATLVRQVEGGTGVGCQNELVLHFGLGEAQSGSKLTIAWPSGKTTEVTEGLSAGAFLTFSELP